MKNIILFSFLFLSLNNFAQNWQLVWSDEFDTPGLPDNTKWSFDTEGNNWDWGNNEAQNYTPAANNNAWVENGNLIIEARKENYTWPGDNETTPYTSARLISKEKGDWLYGKVEVRAKLPTGKGMWPAIWMLPTDWTYGNWPASGELDMMENVGYDPDRIHFNIHTQAYNHTIGTNKGYNTLFNQPYNNYFTYILQWFPDRVEFWVDDVKYFTFNNEGTGYTVWPFDQRFHLLLNIAVGGSWGGAQGIDDAIFPQKMYVDYVRVYQNVQSGVNVNVTAGKGGYVTKTPDQTSYNTNDKVSLDAVPDKSHRFAYWKGDIQSVNNPYDLTVSTDVNAEAVFQHWCEWALNGAFDNGSTFWFLNKLNGATGAMSVNNGALTIDINDSGTELWTESLIQTGLTVENGKTYYFSFDAQAAADRTIRAGIGMNKDPWATYIYQTVNLTTQMKHFVYPFTMTAATDNAARIVFDLGQNDSDVTIDNISLSCMDITTVVDQLEKPEFDYFVREDGVWIRSSSDIQLIQITDLQGRLIRSIEIMPNQYINTGKLTQGIYFITVFNNQNKRVAKILIH